MKTAIVFLFSLAILAHADEKPTVQIKRVASVNWDLQTGKLVWVVQTGAEGKEGFVPSSEEHYEISPKEAVMKFQGQERGFTSQEATWLGNLLQILTGYCIASTIWWYRGESVPSGESNPTTTPPPESTPEPKPSQSPDTGPVKFIAPQAKKAP
jgi:hypothetical protein